MKRCPRKETTHRNTHPLVSRYALMECVSAGMRLVRATMERARRRQHIIFTNGSGHTGPDGRPNMRKPIALAVVGCALTVSACAPSLSYRLGQGFYSDTYAREHVQAAANTGRLKNLGRFSTTAGGCGNYSEELADRKIVIPAVQAKLKEVGANVADRVVVNEAWYDSLLDFLTVPTLLGCTYWTISGEAFLVEEPPGQSDPSVRGPGQPAVFFETRR
jgi:hypothetical protein